MELDDLRDRVKVKIRLHERHLDNLPRANDGKVRRAYELPMARSQAKLETLRWILDNLPES